MADGSVKFDTAIDSSGMRSGLANLGSIAMAGVATAAAALASLGVAATKTGIEFESAFAGVKKTVDATDEELNAIRQDILDMSKEMPLAATEIAGIAEAAGQLGIKTEAITDFTKVMADLGVATNMTSEQAATDLARLANITQMPQDKFDELGSTIVALGNNFATTESEITAMALRLAGAGTQVGLTEDQILSLAAAASSVGLAAEAGGSAFSRVFTMMQLACEEGGDALNGFAEIAGMSGKDFKKAFEQDAAGALTAFIGGLSNAEASGKSAIGMIEELGSVEGYATLKSIAVRDALLRASGASDVFTDALELGAQAWDENNALTKEAEQRYQTLESRLGILKNSASALGIAVYEGIKGPLGEVVSFATGAVQQLEAAFSEGGFEGLISALGAVLGEAVNKIVEFAPTLVSAALGLIENLIDTILGSSGMIIDAAIDIGMQLIQSIATLAPKLIKAAATIISQLAVGLVKALPTLIKTLLDCLTSCVDALIESIPILLEALFLIVEELMAYLPELIPTILEAVLSIVTAIIEYLPELITMLVEQLPLIVEQIVTALLESLPLLIECVMEIVNAIIACLPEIITMICQALPTLITGIVGTLLASIPQIVACGIELFVSLVKALPEIITALCNAIPLIIDSLIIAFNDLFPLIIDCGIELFVALVKELPTIITTILMATGDIINEIIWAVMDSIPLIIRAGVDLLCALVAALPEIIMVLIAAIPTIITSLIDVILGNIGLIAEAGVNLLVALVLNLPAIILELVKAIPEIIAALVKGIVNGVSSMAEAGGQLIAGLWEGIGAKADWIAQKIKSFCKNALDAIKAFFGIKSPSRVFKNVIGKNLMFGLAEGIEDEASTAVAAMGEAAKKVGDVEFSAGGITFDDPEALYAKVDEAVDRQVSGTTTVKSALVNGYDSSSDGENDDGSSGNNPAYIENNIIIDGRKAARIITPYVAEELAWEGK